MRFPLARAAGCFARPASHAELKHLPGYLALMGELYRDEQFLRYRNTHPGGTGWQFKTPALDPGREAALLALSYPPGPVLLRVIKSSPPVRERGDAAILVDHGRGS